MTLSIRFRKLVRAGLLAALFFASNLGARAVTLLWDASPSTNVVGYAVHYGYQSGDYSHRIDVGNNLSVAFQPEKGVSNYFFVVTAYTADGLESLPSNELSFEPPVELPDVSNAAIGSYNGVFMGAPPAENPGSFTLKKTKNNRYSGAVVWMGKRYRFSGTLESGGVATISIPRRDDIPLQLEIHIDPENSDRLVGTLTAGDWVGDLTSDRMVFNAKTNPAPFVGQYTAAIFGLLDKPLTSGGIGFGSIKVQPNGRVSFKGTLGDGKKFSSSTYLSQDGDWPFYVAPYGKTGGAISGRLKFIGQEISGDLAWFKSANPKDKWYPGGFSNSVALIGAAYTPPPTRTNSAITFAEGTLAFQGEALPVNFEKDVIVVGSKILPAIVGSDKLSFRLNQKSGLFTGKILAPDSIKPLKFAGAVLQNTNTGFGLFFTTNQTGQVVLETN